VSPCTPQDRAEALAVLRAEILRWNKQINLVSRVRTPERVGSLIRQCENGWGLVLAALGGADWLHGAGYLDLGSGAGLPGLVWAAAREHLGHDGPSVLVEPRDKRAWFLRRTARRMGLERTTVWPVRWEAGVDGLTVPEVLVSLKALRLSDHEVLAGFAAREEPRARPRRVTIVRFLEPGRTTRADVEERLVEADGGEDRGWRRGGAEILGGGDPGLLLVRYTTT
jgi:hypothetical protein